MDRGFWGSREAVIGAVIAGLVLVSGAGVVASGAEWSLDGCSVQHLRGDPIGPIGTEEQATERSRSLAWSFPGQGNLTVQACTEVGTLYVGPSSDDEVHVTAILRSDWGLAELEASPIAHVRMVDMTDGTGLSVWFSGQGSVGVPWWFGGPTVEMDLEIELPADATHDLHLFTEVGSVEIADVAVSGLEVRVDVGEVKATDLEAQGPVRVLVDVGDIDMRFVPTGDAEASIRTDVGSIHLEGPADNRTGYWITAMGDVGDLNVEMGDLERYDRDMDSTGGRIEARTVGYDGATHQWRMRLVTDVGDIEVETR